MTKERLRELVTKSAALAEGVSLRPHQAESVRRFGETDDGLLLFHGMGTGKSLSSLASIEDMGDSATVAVPAALRMNYDKELKKFLPPTERKKYTVQSYDRAARKGLDKSPILVADEVQRLRNQGRNYQGVMDAARSSERRLLLSGTPLVNAPGDMASIINLLHGKQLYTPQEFENRFVGTKTHYPVLGLFGRGRVEPAVRHKKELMQLLQGRVHTVENLATNDTRPEVLENEIKVPMSPLQNEINRGLQNKLPFWMRWKFKKNLPVSKQQSSQLNAFMSGMRQIGLSPYGFDRRLDAYGAFRQSPKLQETFKRIRENVAKGRKTMVYSNFIDAGLRPLAAAMDKDSIPYGMVHGSGLSDADRRRAVEEYNTDKSKVTLLGPAAREGLSLRGTNDVFMLDPHWNLAQTDQAKARAVRLDSHAHLPPIDRKVNVNWVISEPRRNLLQKLMRSRPGVGADLYLRSRAQEKQKEIEAMLDVLREAGQ